MNEIEKRALEMLLAGENKALEVLRTQLRTATVASREFTGVGFFTRLAVSPASPRLEGRRKLAISDVYAEVNGLAHDAGFVLFVNDGAIDCLECFIVDEHWPEDATIKRAYYVRPEPAGSSNLIESPKRDLEWASRHAF